MKKLIQIFIVCGLFCISCSKKAGDDGSIYVPPPPPGPPVDSGWAFETTPVWSEEFNYNGAPDSNNWGYNLGGSGWGNNELENYTSDTSNAKVANGVLTITAKKEISGSRNYSSARLVSKNKGDFLYGRIEVSAKLPTGKGTWPAIWMLPSGAWAYGDWPNSGEIDIMEQVGFDPFNIHFSAHTKSYNWVINTQKTTTVNIPTATSAFHKYRLDWTPYALRGYYDDALIFTFVNNGTGYAAWPFDKTFHLLLNLAIGGSWGGQQGVDDSIFPTSMVVDYVRLYKIIR
jgi:beta-glucanase (GH16 family)